MKALTNDWLAGWTKLHPPQCRVTVKRKREQWKRIVAALAKVDEDGQ